MSLADIEQVMDAHVDELMSIAGVVGVAIGSLENGIPCIKILVVEKTEEVKKQIPSDLDDHPVVIEVTGTIRGMPDSNRDE
jgi:hypothetical protein